MTSRKPNSRIPRFEPLEGRLTLASNITAAIVGDVLTVTGDDSANSLHVTYGRDSIVLNSQNSTINGQRSFSASQFFGALIVDMRGGVDDVVVRGFAIPNRPDASNITIAMGSGAHESIRLVTTYVLGSINVSSNGPGTSEFTFGARTGGDLNVSTGNGDDTVIVTGSQIGRHLRVFTNGGRDFVGIGAPAGQLTTIGDQVRLDTGAGNDRVEIGNVAADEFFALLGEGDDSFGSFSNSAIRRRTTIDGGAGFDRLRLASNASLPRLNPIGFEFFG